jgi:hypothetical protein
MHKCIPNFQNFILLLCLQLCLQMFFFHELGVFLAIQKQQKSLFVKGLNISTSTQNVWNNVSYPESKVSSYYIMNIERTDTANEELKLLHSVVLHSTMHFFMIHATCQTIWTNNLW